MTEYKDINDFFNKPIPEHIQVTVDLNLEISEQVHRMLELKNWTQTDLAKAMGKSNAEVSKWLSGLHNLTTASIAKMTAALREPIIHTTFGAIKEYSRVTFVPIGISQTLNKKPPTYSDTGQIDQASKTNLKIA